MRKDVLSLLLSASLICTMMPVEGAATRASAAEPGVSGVEVSAQAEEKETGEVTASGTFGETVDAATGEVTKPATHKWSFAESTGVLTISGEGDMPDYTYQNYTTAPWYAYNLKIKKVIFTGNVTSIAAYTFYMYKAVEEVDLTGAAGLVKVGKLAFNSCTSLKKVMGIGQLTSIGSSAFYNTRLSGELVLPNIETLEGSFYNTDITSVSMPKLTTISDYGAFESCTSLKKVDLPELTTISGTNIFNKCSSLEEISLPKLVNITANNTFGYCTGLKKLSLPELTTIPSNFAAGATALQEVTIPKVTTISSHAFENNVSLQEISLPEVTKINGDAFKNCTLLKKISMPKITELSTDVFSGCHSLVYLELPESYTNFCHSDMTIYSPFRLCDSLQRIYIKGTMSKTVPLSVMQSDSQKNYYSDITVFVSSEDDKTKWAEYTSSAGEDKVQVVSDWSSLKKENDVEISMDSYDVSSPKNPVVKKNPANAAVKYHYYERYTDSKNNGAIRFRLLDEANPETAPTVPGDYYIQAVTEETSDYYASSSTFVPFTLYGDVTGDGWVYNNKTTTLTITDTKCMDVEYSSTSEVPWYSYQKDITKVAAGEGVTLSKIAPHAFERMSNITDIELPDTLDSVGINAFYQCKNWKRSNTLTVGDTGAFALYECDNLSCPIIIKDGTTSVGEDAFSLCEQIPSFTIPDSVTNFGAACFNGCKKLTEITIPNNVTEIPNNFISNTTIEKVTIPDGVTSIGDKAFMNTIFTEITLPAGLTSLGKEAFSGCGRLENLTLPESLTTLKAGTFQNMTGLKRICIPSTVTTIEGKASDNYGLFSGCTNLELVVFDKTDYTTDTLGTCGSKGWYDTNQDGKNDGQFTVDQMFNNTNTTMQVVCDGTTYDTLKSYAETNTYWQNWKQTTKGWTSSKILCKPEEFKQKYTAEYTAASNLNEADYKAELWSELQTAMSEAQTLADSGDTLYQKVMNQMDAMKIIQDAVKKFLIDTWKETEGIIESDYYDPDVSDEEAANAWFAYADAADAAKTLLTDGNGTVDEYITCRQELLEAKSLIIPLPTEEAVKALNELKTEINTLSETDYTADSWKALQDALAEADKINEDSMITEIKTVQKKIEEAKAALVRITPLESASPSPSVTPSKKPDVSASPSVTPSKKPDVSASPSAAPTKKPNVSPSPSVAPTKKPSPSKNPKVKKVTVKKVTLKKVKSKKKKTVLVQWKKLSGVTGYQVQLAQNKKFKKGKKTYTVKKAKTVKKTVKKLKRKKKYYVRVRAYKTVKGKKYYGKWSKVKSVKVK